MKDIKINNDLVIICGAIGLAFFYANLDLAETVIIGLFAFMGLKDK